MAPRAIKPASAQPNARPANGTRPSRRESPAGDSGSGVMKLVDWDMTLYLSGGLNSFSGWDGR